MKYGVLVISHGSRDAEWVRLVDEAVEAVRLPGDVPVFSSYLELVDGRLIQDGIDELERQGATDLIVVPFFVSSGSTHVDEIMWALGVTEEPKRETDLEPFRVAARLHPCPPMDDDPDVAQILWEKLQAASVDPARELLLLVGHGSNEKGFHKAWREGMLKLAERVRALGGFAKADIAMLLPNQAPCKMKLAARRHPELTVVVAPLFISDGYFTRAVIPERLAGYSYRYSGQAMLPHPLLSRWMERQIAAYLDSAASNDDTA
ncbi:sirohydrochlorin chelatase [Paenibacillus turpanensis]|uniref:sirohydrochlorin chelatase n=1 Tax=Paenibacillus turpanensis TaxID=2689078 RepID=UPI0031329837